MCQRTTLASLNVFHKNIISSNSRVSPPIKRPIPQTHLHSQLTCIYTYMQALRHAEYVNCPCNSNDRAVVFEQWLIYGCRAQGNVQVHGNETFMSVPEAFDIIRSHSHLLQRNNTGVSPHELIAPKTTVFHSATRRNPGNHTLSKEQQIPSRSILSSPHCSSTHGPAIDMCSNRPRRHNPALAVV